MISEHTLYVNCKDITRKWYIIDAKDVILGKVATTAAVLLRGKHKPEFTPHQEIGDYVIIINARHVKLTGKKASQKTYYRHSGYPGSLKDEVFETVIVRKPTYPLEHAIRLMLPKNKMGYKLFSNLKIYADEHHKHHAQNPQIFEVQQ